VNPVVCEAVRQVAAQVIGNDAAVAFAGSQGDFELNVMLPVMARNLLESVRLLASVSRLFATRCIAGLVADEQRTRELAESSPAIVTPLNRYVGYDEAAAIAKQALAERTTIRAAAIARGHGDLDLDEILDVLKMTGPAAG
jgi:fumarate hydratase class II